MSFVNCKTLDDVVVELRDHEVATGSKYVVIDSCKTFSAEKIELTGKLQLHWDDDQIPFFHFGTRNYQCHQGKDTNEYQKRKYAQLRDKMAQEDHCFIKRYKQAQTTKKLGCPARVQVTRIIKMFQYKLTGLISKYAKDRVSRLIKKKVADGVLIGEEMYLMKFPNQDDHKYHLQGSNADNSSSGYGQIPLTGSKCKNIINDCNATMRSITSALWYVEEEKLLQYQKSLKELFSEISSNISVDSRCGLPIEPERPLKRRYAPSKSAPEEESANKIVKKYKKLRLNRHKKASSGRVGHVADLMKSASKVVVSSIDVTDT